MKDDPRQPAHGAYASLDRLISLRLAARQFDIRKQRRALARLAGNRRAHFRGRGIEFEEVRHYQAGDDIRAIDWRVTARTGEAHTKLFHEERERPVLIAVDQRASQFFGSRHCFRSVLAADLAALVAWSALAAGERVGGLVFDDSGHRDLRPRRSRHTVLGLLSMTCEFNARLQAPGQPNAEAFAEMLRNLRRIARPGSSLFLISDFAGGLGERGREHLFQLARHVEITAVHCTDPMDRELPPAGLYSVSDGQARRVIATGDAALRERYRRQWEDSRDALRDTLGRLGIPCIEASTAAPALDALRDHFGKAA